MTKADLSSGTFSIRAVSPDSKFMGVAVASGSASVSERVPYAKPGIGVIATQAYTNVTYGTKGLELLIQGLSPQETLSKLLEEDSGRDFRQVAMIDFKKRKTVFTGASVQEFSAEIMKENYIVIGNLLSRSAVISAMAKQFEISSDSLAWGMMNALRAGRKSGGDKRGEKSAALIVVDAEKVEVEVKIASHKILLKRYLES
ncbi:DUF1028 domain-containing protein [Candidatus Bathyarchaeota archaeon]|nr:DUF1028 domain-containing protein [Candidatus Bathyarchaeota archaeon]